MIQLCYVSIYIKNPNDVVSHTESPKSLVWRVWPLSSGCSKPELERRGKGKCNWLEIGLNKWVEKEGPGREENDRDKLIGRRLRQSEGKRHLVESKTCRAMTGRGFRGYRESYKMMSVHTRTMWTRQSSSQHTCLYHTKDRCKHRVEGDSQYPGM